MTKTESKFAVKISTAHLFQLPMCLNTNQELLSVPLVHIIFFVRPVIPAHSTGLPLPKLGSAGGFFQLKGVFPSHYR